MRLDKYLAENSQYSRKDVARLVKQGRVRINELECKSASHQISEHDAVFLDEQQVAAQQNCYLMLHKPVGYVSATKDSEQPTVVDLLQGDFSPLLLNKLQVAGRLDIDTTGLLLLTSDGQWNHMITAPSRSCKKRYLVDTEQPISRETVDAFSQGILLKGESKNTRPAALHIIDRCKAEVTISEGRYHQIKRMFAACGNRVSALHRRAIGNITLDPALKQGQYRNLTEDEIGSVYSEIIR